MDKDKEANQEEEPVAQAAVEGAAPERRRRRRGFTAGVLLGLLTGAGVATLFTPFSGQEVRQQTSEKAPIIWKNRGPLARAASQTVRSRLNEAMEAGREGARDAEEASRRRFERLTGRRPGEP